MKKDLYIQLVFPLSIKLINPIQKYPHIIELYACILKMFVLMFLVFDKFLNFFRSMFYSKTIKISNIIIIIINIQSNPISSNIRILIKIYYIYLILYLIRLIRVNLDSFWQQVCVLKSIKRWGGNIWVFLNRRSLT